MTYQGSGGHQGVQGGARGSRGVPGRSRLPLAPKWVIKTAKNGPKPWFKVSKMYPDPKRMVLIHFWGIWGHLGALKQRYLVKTPICQNQVLGKFTLSTIVQAPWSKKSYFKDFSNNIQVPNIVGKIRKVWFFGPGGVNNCTQGFSYFLRKCDFFLQKCVKNGKQLKKLF